MVDVAFVLLSNAIKTFDKQIFYVSGGDRISPKGSRNKELNILKS